MITENIGHLAAILVSSLIALGYLVVVLAGVFPLIAGGAWVVAQLATFVDDENGERDERLARQTVAQLRPHRRQRGVEALESAC